MSFAQITGDLQKALASELAQIMLLLKRNPASGYARIVEIGRSVGAAHGIVLVVNFPKQDRIREYSMYGRRDISIIVDKERTRFPVSRDAIKAEAERLMPSARCEDAYMYEGKEGVKVFHAGGRIDILPHSVHVWCEFTPEVGAYCEWLLGRVYGLPRDRR